MHSLHYESDFIIFYFLKGTGNLKVEGKQYDIGEGDIVIVNPRELYQLNVDDDKFHERISLNANETLLKYFPDSGSPVFMNMYKRKKGEHNRISASVVKSYGLDTDFQNLIELAKSKEPISSILTICKIVEFLIKIGQTIMLDVPGEKENIHESPLVSEVIKYIKLHLKENIDIETISRDFNVGKSYLSHLFKEQVGISLWNYVIIRRIYLFNNLIAERTSVEDTCYEVGFKNYSNFFRLYKKHMNMTPTEFKKQVSTEKK